MEQARRRAGIRTWTPIALLVVVIIAVVAVVWVSVAANRPTAGRPDDVAIYSPPQRRETMTDLLSGVLHREAGCTYLDADDGRRWIALFPDVGIRWEGDWLYVGVRTFETEALIDVRGQIIKIPAAGISTTIPEACGGTSDFFLMPA